MLLGMLRMLLGMLRMLCGNVKNAVGNVKNAIGNVKNAFLRVKRVKGVCDIRGWACFSRGGPFSGRHFLGVHRL